MKRLKKTLRLFGLGTLIVLATLGVGISGGVTVTSTKKREDSEEIKTEVVENREGQTRVVKLKDIKF